jgi:tetratricopeptide (TPR) repeat protein
MHSSNRILSFSVIIFVFDHGLKCSSSNSCELVTEGAKYSEKGDYDKSFDSCLKATKLDPKNVNAFYGLGGIYNYRNEYEKAAQAFKTVIKHKDDDRKRKNAIRRVHKFKIQIEKFPHSWFTCKHSPLYG